MAALTVEQLRKQLRDRFPEAHGVRSRATLLPAREALALDDFPPGAISEVVPEGGASGLTLLIARFLEDENFPNFPSPYPELVLIDGGDRFDPASYAASACSKLLWVRCHTPSEVLKTVDLLIRDRNIPTLVMDLTSLGIKACRSIPASAWWRLRQLVNGSDVRLVVLCPEPVIPCAGVRVSLSAGLTLSDFDHFRSELFSRLSALAQTTRRAR
ncbi:MAG: hypothetical protein QM627_08920 [Luteolibacter sp.]